MLGLLYYAYKKNKYGVLFNGEVSELKILIALESITYWLILLVLITQK